MKCLNCPLSGDAQVQSEGPEKSKLFIVIESPGPDELATGRPATGRTGQLLRGVLDSLDYSDYTIGNATQCLPPEVESLQRECRTACRSRLLQDIKGRDPKLVLAMGAGACNSILIRDKVMSLRGSFFKSPEGFNVLASLNPAYYLHASKYESKNKLSVNDLFDTVALAIRYLRDETSSELQPKVGEHYKLDYDIVSNVEQLEAILDHIGNDPRLSLDLETSGLDPIDDSILELVLGTETKSYIVEWSTVKSNPAIFLVLKEFIENNAYITYNGFFDIGFLRQSGIFAKLHRDLFLERYTIDESPTNGGLKMRGQLDLGVPSWEGELKKYVPKKTDSYSKVPRDIRIKYAAYDGIYTSNLARVHDSNPEMDEHSEFLLHNILIPITEVFLKIRLRGVPVNPFALVEANKALELEIKELDRLLQEISGIRMNLNAPHDVARALFGIFGFTPVKGNSTDREVLEGLLNKASTKRDLAKVLTPEVPTIEDLLNSSIEVMRNLLETPYPGYLFLMILLIRRDRQKTKTTYIAELAGSIKKDSRLHPIVYSTGTMTGRATATQPSVFNVKESPLIKNIYQPFSTKGEPWHFYHADESQFELRTYAGLSQDRGMIDFFVLQHLNRLKGLPVVDIHTYAQELTGAMSRLIAKTFVFGPLYGRTDESIARDLGIPLEDAKIIGAKIRALFPEGQAFAHARLEEALATNMVITPFGRKRHFPYIDNAMVRQIKNVCANTPTQSTANDLNFLSLIEIERLIDRKEIDMECFFPVHDSIEAGGPKDQTEANLQAMEEVMMGIAKKWLPELYSGIPLLVEAKAGDTWEEADPSPRGNRLVGEIV